MSKQTGLPTDKFFEQAEQAQKKRTSRPKKTEKPKNETVARTFKMDMDTVHKLNQLKVDETKRRGRSVTLGELLSEAIEAYVKAKQAVE